MVKSSLLHFLILPSLLSLARRLTSPAVVQAMPLLIPRLAARLLSPAAGATGLLYLAVVSSAGRCAAFAPPATRSVAWAPPIHRAAQSHSQFQMPPRRLLSVKAPKRIKKLGVTASAKPVTQGQIDGLFSQLPYKCHQNRVASVGD